MAGAAPTMTQAEFARHRGVSRKTITHWKQRGLVVLVDGGAVDVAASEARLAERPECYRGGEVTALPAGEVTPPGNSPPVDPPARVTPLPEASGPLPDDPSTWTTAEAQRAKEQALARRQRRADALEDGRLVEIDAVATLVEAEYSVVRNRLLAIPGKVAAHLVGLTVERIIAALQEEIAEALHELHDPAGLADRARGPGGSPPAGEGGA